MAGYEENAVAWEEGERLVRGCCDVDDNCVEREPDNDANEEQGCVQGCDAAGAVQCEQRGCRALRKGAPCNGKQTPGKGVADAVDGVKEDGRGVEDSTGAGVEVESGCSDVDEGDADTQRETEDTEENGDTGRKQTERGAQCVCEGEPTATMRA